MASTLGSVGHSALVIVAHPDDEVLGCGASISKWSEAGCTVKVLLPLKRHSSHLRVPWDEAIVRFRRSCSLLGAEPLILECLLDERRAHIEIDSLHDLISPLVESADLVLTHWGGDANQVHRGLASAVEIATRPFRCRKNVWLFEIPTSTDQSFRNTFVPATYVLLEERHVARKCEAMEIYLEEHAFGRRPEDLKLRMAVRGREAGAAFAEAFVPARLFF